MVFLINKNLKPDIKIIKNIDLIIDGKGLQFKKNDCYFIPMGVKHSGKIYKGYAYIAYFNLISTFIA